jgi:hypothetical protein
MRNLLLAITLLFSSIAFAGDTTLALTGFTVEKGQVVTVELRNAEHIFITMLRIPVDITEGDELEVVLEDAVPGTYDMRVTVREYNARNDRQDNKLSIGNVVKQQITQVTID